MQYLDLDKKALENVSRLNLVVRDLVDSLEAIDKVRAYLAWGYSSLWNYCLMRLKLSESQTHEFISVMRKSREVPELKEAVVSGSISLNKAALITKQLTPENSGKWLDLAKELKTRELKFELAKENPKAIPEERVTVRTEERVEVKLSLTRQEFEELKKAQDFLSQKEKKYLTLSEALPMLIEAFNDKHLPERRAARLLRPSKVTGSIPEGRIKHSAWVRHTVFQKAQGQCMSVLPNGKRCENRRFLEIHHRKPLSHGGTNHPDNLTVLCSGHHRGTHFSFSKEDKNIF